MENGLLYILAFSAMAIALFACVLPQATSLEIQPGDYTSIVYIEGSEYVAENSIGTELYRSTNPNTTINGAINFTHDAGGGTVFLKNGNYANADIILSDKAVRLEGEMRQYTKVHSITVNNSAVMISQSIANILIDGTNYQSDGLYVRNMWKTSITNVNIQNAFNGLHTHDILDLEFYDLSVVSCNISVLLDYTPADSVGSTNSKFFGGRMESSNISIMIRGSNWQNIFYGTLIENSNLTQINFETLAGGYVPYSNIFDSCYIENEPSHTTDLITFTRTGSEVPSRGNQFKSCKFALNNQSLTIANITGNFNVFSNNVIDAWSGKTATIIFAGTGNIMRDTSAPLGGFFTVTYTQLATGNTLYNNVQQLGYYGIVGISNGDYYVNVNHHQAVAPDIARVQVTPMTNMTGYTWYVIAHPSVPETYFRILVTPQNSLGTNMNFAWYLLPI